jgi:hypothetical protein
VVVEEVVLISDNLVVLVVLVVEVQVNHTLLKDHLKLEIMEQEIQVEVEVLKVVQEVQE